MNFSLPIAQNLDLELIDIEGYEAVIKVTSQEVGLTAIISIHNTALGTPALGGTRIQPYPSFEQALEDVLRLSKGMTYKSAIAQVGYGGGKSVIIADPKKDKTKELLTAFAEAVDLLEGRYICAEDVGSTLEDMRIIRQKTPYVVGLSHAKSSGNPSPFTAFGVHRGIQATLKKRFGSDSIQGRKIAVQGLGSVGSFLVDTLFWAGAELIITDVDLEKAHKIGKQYGAKVVAPNEILEVECDLLAPCALGGIINSESIPHLKCKAIAGAANNQLLQDLDADLLREKEILYAPDFVINAGGLINVTSELEEGGYNPINSRNKTDQIYNTLLAIYEIAEKNKESTQKAALNLADEKIINGIGKRTTPPTYPESI